VPDVPVRRLESSPAFLVTDLPDAPLAVGVVRAAPKVLVDGAELLARATTYAFATFGVQAGGASAGVNAGPDDKADAIARFVEEVAPEVAAGRLHLSAGTGVTDDDLAPLGVDPVDPSLAPAGAVAAAVAFLGGDVAGRSAVVHGPGSWAARVGPAWTAAGGGAVTEGDPNADTEVLFVAGKAGVLDHHVAGGVTARLVVPLTPVPVTAKAYAALSRAGTTFVPDALALAAPLLAVADPGGGDPLERVRGVAAAMAAHGVDAWRAMVERAESFLAGWQDERPFGRPLA
jgi:hypothetical protein